MTHPGEYWLSLLRGEPRNGQIPLDRQGWVVLTSLAAQHQLGALTYRLLADSGVLTGAPPDVQERLRTTYMQHAIRNAVMFRDTRRAIRVLDGAGIATMLLKGVHLARYVYAEPALRSMADLDLMVPRDRLVEAEALLLAQGYGPIPRPDPVEFCRRSNHLAKLIKPGEQVIELHWAIERPTSPFTIDPRALWSRARAVTFEGCHAWVLAPEDTLLHLALHTSFHHGFDRSALKALVDLQQVVAQSADGIDWTSLVGRANAWGAGGFVFATFRVASDLLRVPIPEHALERLDHSSEDEEVAEAALRYVLMPPADLTQPFVELARQGWSERWRSIVRRAFPPRPTIAQLYSVSPSSPIVFPLYVIRALGLIGRRGGMLLRALLPGGPRRRALEREAIRELISLWTNESRLGEVSSDR